jgi:hypothetical protein
MCVPPPPPPTHTHPLMYPHTHTRTHQVSHVFSDKTGTVTKNLMVFRKISVGGVSYGLGTTEIGIARRVREGCSQRVCVRALLCAWCPTCVAGALCPSAAYGAWCACVSCECGSGVGWGG